MDEPTTPPVPPIDGEGPRRVLFEPFTWHSKGGDFETDRAAEFAGKVRDITCGAALMLAIVERDELDESCTYDDGEEIPALLGVDDKGSFMRMCITSLAMLRDEAEREIDRIDTRTAKQ